MQEPAFHPAVADWFTQAFRVPTACQARAWQALASRRHTLVAAPTGSGKTLAAFLIAIDELVRQGLAQGLSEGVQTLYVSPLKALSNDIQRNLEAPLAGIRERLRALDLPPVPIATAVRTGDTPPAMRTLMRRRPPHILVTTPESLYVLLTSDSGRDMLSRVRTVIVDEIHALAGNKRGAHLSLSLERLTALTAQPPTRIGLSATQRPLRDIADFLIGARPVDAGGACEIVDEGHVRERDLGIELPSAPLETVLSGEMSAEIYDRIAALISQHRTTLVFVNTRRMAERVAKALSDRIGDAALTSHHGSMAKDRRLLAEQRLKAGELRALVATASLELGIDIGEVDLVCQIGSTRALATLLQRVGRAGHAIGAVAKGRLFPQSRDELVECAALLDMTRRGELDCISVIGPVLDVLAQQIVAETACRDYRVDELFELCRLAYPYRDLRREAFDQVLAMLAEGYSFAHGRRSAYLHLDAVNGMVRARRGARLVAVTCGGAIPDTADYDVIVEPGGQLVGTVNEDFAIESLPGNIFQLGNASWRILRVETSALRVADAAGQPPNIPFWFGEAPARSQEMSQAVSRLRAEFVRRADGAAPESRRAEIETWFAHEIGVGLPAARQLHDYLLSGYRALGAMPTQDTLVMERFFDESGGMQLVIHSPFGSRLNRGWGLALRKRFCRQFNFELQAAAVEDAIVISLGAVHSFPLDEVWQYLKPDSVQEVLTQALLDAPMFAVRWRWVAACALAIQRFRNGSKVPARLLRMQADDLVALVFPDQLACAENLQGPREIPTHPLVQQAIGDCLCDAMDVEGLKALLAAIQRGDKRLVARDQTEPSPLALAVLNANPYAFLDDAPLEERRTHAVQSRRWLDPEAAGGLGALDAGAITRVRAEVWPMPQSAEELHEALLLLGVSPPGELSAVAAPSTVESWIDELCRTRRISLVALAGDQGRAWVAAERYEEVNSVWPRLSLLRGSGAVASRAAAGGREAAIKSLLRGRLEVSGPIARDQLAAVLPLTAGELDFALAALEAEGIILRGRFTPGQDALEWCDRRLLARIHRYTMNRLRAEIEPVPASVYVRFLLDWHYLTPNTQVEGTQATLKVIEQLAGFEAPAAAWEGALLPGRVRDYSGDYLDQLIAAGRCTWLRLGAKSGGAKASGPLRTTPMSLLPRHALKPWLSLAAGPDPGSPAPMSSAAAQVFEFLHARGASFFEDIVEGTGLLRAQSEMALGELVAGGIVTADSFIGMRVLLTPSAKRRPLSGSRRRRAGGPGIEDAGRWQVVARTGSAVMDPYDPAGSVIEHIARTLLLRYGIVFRRVLEREPRLPPWRDLLVVLRRLEARGEVRGGRFVAGFSGEQYALPGAVEALRQTRNRGAGRQFVAVSGADPLNLAGIVVPGLRIPATAGNRIVYLDGEAIAVQLAAEVRWLRPLAVEDQIRARTALSGIKPPRNLRAYLRR